MSDKFSALRFWRNTDIASLTAGQQVTFPPGTLGFEWDTEADNGFRPRGLMRLSHTTVDNVVRLVDFGSSYSNSTEDHYLTLYRATSGSLVFGAGTIQWAWGLDSHHAFSNGLDDIRMKQATVNMLADMGIQPANLQAGLVTASASSDSQPPVSSIDSLVNGSVVVVQSNSTLLISGSANDLGGGVVAGVEVSIDGGATWHPADGRENWSYTWTPPGNGTYTILVTAVDDSGNLETPGLGIDFTVEIACPCSIWDDTPIPSEVSAADTDSVELGMKFQADRDGYIKALQFYKGPANTGTHVGSLWRTDGTLLAQVTFQNETATGWQEQALVNPVAVTANTTYVVSYHAPNAGYSQDRDFFSTGGVGFSPLRALADGEDGSNGVYAYGPTSQFPTSGWRSSNYWVDVVFDTTIIDVQAPLVIARSPAPDATGVAVATPVTVQFSEAIQEVSINFELRDVGGTLVPATLSYDSATNTATLTPVASLIADITYTATVVDALDLVGNPLGIADSWSFTTVLLVCPCSIWDDTAIPGVVSSGDPDSVELGMKFQADQDGYITALRFYKGPSNTGTHGGSLWSTHGTLLAQVTFQNETATGWQKQALISPVAVTANTTYVVSYHAPNGRYARDVGFFSASGVDNAPLRALANGEEGGNGVYIYGATSQFPASSYNSTNYWVDVVFDITIN